MSITYGRVPKPKITVRDIPSSVNTAWNDLGQRVPRFVVLHRMIGTLTGTDTYFRTDARKRALTDYGVDNTSGLTYRWNDPWGRRAPWASGPWGNPPGDGRAIVAKFGSEAINRDGVSIEVAGNYDSTVSQLAQAQIVELIAWHADQAQVPHTSWPVNPATGTSFVLWHNEFTTEKPCPGTVVMAITPDLIERVGKRLKQYQEGVPVEAPEKPAETQEAGVNGIPYRKLFGPLYDDKGTVSALWRETGSKTGKYPPLAAYNTAAGYFQFSDGSVIVRDKAGKVSYLGPAKG